MDVKRLTVIARRQKGLFTRAQAVACGFTPRQIRHRLQVGRWIKVYGRVFAEAGVRITPELSDRAAQLAVRGSVLAGLSAARVWGLGLPHAEPYLLVVRHLTGPVPGIRVSRTSSLTREHVQIFEGIPVTSRTRTIVDCLLLLPQPQAINLLDRALQQRWITLDDLVEWIGRLTGHRGVARLLALLKHALPGARSAAERLATRLLLDAGISGWRANVAIYDDNGLIGLGDIVFDEAKLVVEIDGLAYHVTPDRFQHDRYRQNRLIAAGWTVLRFTWHDLNERPHYVISTITRMLDRPSGTS